MAYFWDHPENSPPRSDRRQITDKPIFERER